ncbi:MAG: hypothetical protein IH616_19270 [Gemmatimonadales bacterium]|nr:hypothetical protein [Gemmatimonadales bacterium]
MTEELNAPRLPIGYDLPLPVPYTREPCISASRGTTSIGIEDPPQYSEPAVCLMRPDDTLTCGAVQARPFARRHFDELLAAIDFAVAKHYPGRGGHVGEL